MTWNLKLTTLKNRNKLKEADIYAENNTLR